MLVTGLALDEVRDPSIPDAYYEARARGPEQVAEAIRKAGGTAIAISWD